MGGDASKELDEAALRNLTTSQVSDTLDGPSRRQVVDQQLKDTKQMAGRLDKAAKRAENRFHDIFVTSNYSSPVQSSMPFNPSELAEDRWFAEAMENYKGKHHLLPPSNISLPGTNIRLKSGKPLINKNKWQNIKRTPYSETMTKSSTPHVNAGETLRQGIRPLDASAFVMNDTPRLGSQPRKGAPFTHSVGQFGASSRRAFPPGYDPLFAPTTVPSQPWFNPAYDDQFRFAQTKQPSNKNASKRDELEGDIFYGSKKKTDTRKRAQEEVMDQLYGGRQGWDATHAPNFNYLPFNRFIN